MKLIIAGSRSYETDEPANFIRMTLNLLLDSASETEIVSGGCAGIDKMGEAYAKWFNVPIKEFPADWEKHGRSAGPIRNREMAEYADVLVLIWNGKSKGSGGMKKEMEKLNKPIYEVILKKC